METSALRQLTEYARPHASYSPYAHPMAHHMAGANLPSLAMHGPNAANAQQLDLLAFTQYHMLKDRFEAEEKQKAAMMEKQKEIESKSRNPNQSHSQSNSQMSVTPTSSASSLYDQQMEMQRRLSSSASNLANSPSLPNNSNTSNANGLSLSGASSANQPLNPFMFFSQNDRSAQDPMQQLAERLKADRFAMAASDPLFRMQMGLNAEMHGQGPAGSGHAFQHPGSVHSIHGSGNPNVDSAALQLANAAAAMGLPSPQFDPAMHSGHSMTYPSRPSSILPRPELSQTPSMFRSIEDQLQHQVNAQMVQQAEYVNDVYKQMQNHALQQEHIQRQMLLERDRLLAAQMVGASSHPQQLLQEEYLR